MSPQLGPPVTNTAVLPLTSPQTINGTFTQTPTGTLSVSIDPQNINNASALLTVLGCASVSGALQLNLSSPVAVDTSLAVVRSPCVSGQFDNISVVGPARSCTSAGRQTVTSGSLSVLLQNVCTTGGLSVAQIAIIAAVLVVVLLALAAGVGFVLYRKANPYHKYFGYELDDANKEAITPGRPTYAAAARTSSAYRE
jgi:hypothetical protein